MSIALMEVTGIPHAWAALKQSRRNYLRGDHMRDMEISRQMTNSRGFIRSQVELVEDHVVDRIGQDAIDSYMEHLDILAKWGAGVNQKKAGAWYDAGHETLLRFIDFTFVVEDLHRGGMDDLDSHACRFDNRIIRSSTRLSHNVYGQSERSPWYADRIRSVEDIASVYGLELPERAVCDGEVWVKSANGYVREGLEDNQDVVRGNYPLAIPMSAVMRINLVDLRHVYMRRNIYTHAAPELKDDIESLADQIENAIPGDLGKLIRYDYALNEKTGEYEMAHIMNIKKVIDTSRTDGAR